MFFLKNSLTVKLYNKFKYPKLSLHHSVNFDIKGSFSYGADCSLVNNVNVIIPEETSLILGDGCRVGRYVELGPFHKIDIGRNSSIQDRCILLGDVVIGKHCLLSLNVLISSGQHYYKLNPYWLIKDQDKYALKTKSYMQNHSKPVSIGDDCWLGVNVVVMPGVTIGKGAVVGANSVVTKDVEPYTVVAGSPVKIIKKRLEFISLKLIIYNKETDMPYFYSGFEVSEKDLLESAKYCGVFANTNFKICLDIQNMSFIHIRLRKITKSDVTLSYKSIHNDLLTEFQTFSYEASNLESNIFDFNLIGKEIGNKVVVQKAWAS
jgi:acetyltransferase-like isoleucine patch superfamily enzyme